MSVLKDLKPTRVFHYFEELCAIPHGSENMEKISEYCINFAKANSLKYYTDEARNVVIYKEASLGYENAEPVILQGHLDMVCQCEENKKIDFLTDSLELYIDGEFVKAKGTTLGADNGIAVAMILAILENKELAHPKIEAVFTTDEEIGMIGATKLDMKVLSAKKMINLDSEDWDTVTVSCAGGSDFRAELPFTRQTVNETPITISLKGLKGGHSGICIAYGRVNANILGGRLLDYLNKSATFNIISVNGGDKGNAIPLCCEIKLCSSNAEALKQLAEAYLETIKLEISEREPDFEYSIMCDGKKELKVLPKEFADKLIYLLLCAPNGVVEMSAEIEGLVETSLNLGILKTEEDNINFLFALRSNKKSAIKFLEEKLKTYFTIAQTEIKTGGHYPPWEFNSNSCMQEIYNLVFFEQFGIEPKVEAIHAGLECGVFSDAIDGFDCIAIGPQMYDVHTVNERLNIASTEKIYTLLLKILEKLI